MTEKRTPKSWTHYLSDDDGQYTLEEYTAGCLSMMLGHLMAMREAMEHVEGMTGAFDDLLSKSYGDTYASSPAVRAALDARRDEHRRLAAEQRDEEGQG